MTITDPANTCLYIVIPCYNEEEVLPRTTPLFVDKLRRLVRDGLVGQGSKILFVNDGSSDNSWELISQFAKEHDEVEGICLSRNRGHQNSLLAGLMECKDSCDVSISIDCDGQDDIEAMDEMLVSYHGGCDVVYGVRKARDKDSAFKRTTAHAFYSLMRVLGADIVYDHADYRLLSSRVLDELADYEEVNLFLRGMVSLVGFKSDVVYYEREERMAGTSKYPLKKMLSFAVDGITSLSTRPLQLISGFGAVVSLLSMIGIVYALISYLAGRSVSGWASLIVALCFFGGVQLLSLGVVGTYVGKTYLETKRRPRWSISSRTWDQVDSRVFLRSSDGGAGFTEC